MDASTLTAILTLGGVVLTLGVNGFVQYKIMRETNSNAIRVIGETKRIEEQWKLASGEHGALLAMVEKFLVDNDPEIAFKEGRRQVVRIAESLTRINIRIDSSNQADMTLWEALHIFGLHLSEALRFVSPINPETSDDYQKSLEYHGKCLDAARNWHAHFQSLARSNEIAPGSESEPG